MIKDRRRSWALLLFIGIFVPYVVMLAFSMATSSGPRTSHVAVAGAGGAASATGGGGAGRGSTPADVPLLAAGDGKEVWVARPVTGENKTPGFELLNRPANSTSWRVSVRLGTQTFWNTQGYPRTLMLRLPPDGNRAGIPFIIGQDGGVVSYTLEDDTQRGTIPAADRIKASAGAPEELFVIGYGPPPRKTLAPGDPLEEALPSTVPFAAVAPSPTTLPATTSSMPATTKAATTAPAIGAIETGWGFNTYWMTNSWQWSYLPGLGAGAGGGGGDASAVPTASSLMALAVRDNRLIAMWVDPVRPSELVVRTLEYRKDNAPNKDAAWSEPIRTSLPGRANGGPVPADSRLLAVTVDKTLYVLWTVPTGDGVALHGGWMITDQKSPNAYHLPPENLILPMSLDGSGGISPSMDVAVGATENSILVVSRSKESAGASAGANVGDGLVWHLFDGSGRKLSGPLPLEPRLPRRDLQIGQNIAMILLALMMVLSLWQWRQKALTLALPTGTVIAPLHLRAGAFLMDAAIPYVVILAIFGMGDGPFAYVTAWITAMSRPDELLKSPELFVFIGLYLVHVTLGELIFHRSIGKAIVGARVLMLDGKAPTIAAILVRNLIRLPEFAVGIVILYILISDRRQRLGDLIARTIVVTQQPLETPADPDKEPPERK